MPHPPPATLRPASIAAGHAGPTQADGTALVDAAHGVIRCAFVDSPCLYMTGVTNALRQFDFETTRGVYSRNLAVAHNAGVAVAWLIPQLVETL